MLAIHEQLIVQHGGLVGVRDQGLLESALASPQNHHAYAKVDTHDLAAAYAYALCRDHPFHDGNKRAALTAAGVFLELNGFMLRASEAEAVLVTMALSAGDLDREGYAEWLRLNSKRFKRR